MILDFGPASVADLKRRLGGVKTVLWNGPLGAFETAPFGEGTLALAREVARLTRAGRLVSVAGGGDTVRALNAAGSPAILPMCRRPAARSWNGSAATNCRRSWRSPEAGPAPRLRSIHAFFPIQKDVDARHKAGHDNFG